jgi:6-phosphogluconolactonase
MQAIITCRLQDAGKEAGMELPGQVRVVDDVPRAFARIVAELAPRSIALSGGDLAKQSYAALRGEPFQWSATEVFFGDERMVPIESDDSNEGVARRVLLDAVGPRTVHSLVQSGADAYDALVRSHPPLDLVHLGLGPDGHTASLFPGSPALEVRDRYVVETEDAAHPHRRLTFTFPAIAHSGVVIVTVAGAEKREPIERIRAGEDLPGARIRAPRVLWLGDVEALGAG